MSDGEPLGLPDPIEASPSTIRARADDLDELHEDMLGQSEDTDTQMRSSADEFTELIAWDISSASADELMAWEEASKALTYGVGVLRLWAEDIDTYMAARGSLNSRWEAARDGLWTESLTDLREELLLEHLEHWRTLMDQAEQAESDLRNGPSKDTQERMVEQGLLTAGQIATYGDHYPGMVPDEIDGSEPPHQVNAWWDSLSKDEREQAMDEDPELLRDLDGIPSDVRNQLNREHLDTEVEETEARLEELRDELQNLGHGNSDMARGANIAEEIQGLESDLGPMTTLQDELGESSESSNEFLLAFERGENGRAIVSHGNPDTADNVATMVPGTNSTWESINSQMDYAGGVAEASDEFSDGDTNAVISWVGYDAPEDLGALSGRGADNAVDELSRFQDGLRSTYQGTTPSHNTIIGHSYGSTVLGHTAMSETGIDADDMIFVGSPGVSADDSRDLEFSPGSVHATSAENDNINEWWVIPHGPEPSSGDDPQIEDFPSLPGSEGGGIFFGDAHRQVEYFHEDNVSMNYIGQVVAGITPEMLEGEES